MDTKPDLENQQRKSETYPTRPERNWRRSLVAATGAAVVIVAVIVAVVVANRDENRSVAEEPPIGVTKAEAEAIALGREFWQGVADEDTAHLETMQYASSPTFSDRQVANWALFMATDSWGGEVGECRLSLFPTLTGITVECTVSFDHALVGGPITDTAVVGIIDGRIGDSRPPESFAAAALGLQNWVAETYTVEYGTVCDQSKYPTGEVFFDDETLGPERATVAYHPDCSRFIASHLEEYLAATGAD